MKLAYPESHLYQNHKELIDTVTVEAFDGGIKWLDSPPDYLFTRPKGKVSLKLNSSILCIVAVGLVEESDGRFHWFVSGCYMVIKSGTIYPEYKWTRKEKAKLLGIVKAFLYDVGVKDRPTYHYTNHSYVARKPCSDDDLRLIGLARAEKEGVPNEPVGTTNSKVAAKPRRKRAVAKKPSEGLGEGDGKPKAVKKRRVSNTKPDASPNGL